MAFALELCGPHRSLCSPVERPLGEYRSPAAEFLADHLGIQLAKVLLTHRGPPLVRHHLQSA